MLWPALSGVSHFHWVYERQSLWPVADPEVASHHNSPQCFASSQPYSNLPRCWISFALGSPWNQYLAEESPGGSRGISPSLPFTPGRRDPPRFYHQRTARRRLRLAFVRSLKEAPEEDAKFCDDFAAFQAVWAM